MRTQHRGGGKGKGGSLPWGPGPCPLSTHPQVSRTLGCWRRARWSLQEQGKGGSEQAAVKPHLARFWKGQGVAMSPISLTGILGLATPREGSWDLSRHHPAPSLLCSEDAGGAGGDAHQVEE